MLDADLTLSRGTLELELTLQVAAGEVVALLGPNGSGKTTTLRAIAGLQPIAAGRVELDGTVLDEPSTHTFVQPSERRIGYVFQDHLLFPRMSVLDNVAFGLRSRGERRATARATATATLERLGLTDLAGARPHELSGGQSQRVALARALATAPRLMLLDEPLASLDATAKAAVRTELRHDLVAVGGPRLLVTHDAVDAAVLADRLVIVEAGRVVQSGTVEEVSTRPASRFVADLLGVDLLSGVGDGRHAVRLASGAVLTLADPVPDGEVSLAVRPRAVALYATRPEGSPRNTWEATVGLVEVDVDRARVQLVGPVSVTAEVTPAAIRELGITTGATVWASVKAVDLVAYER